MVASSSNLLLVEASSSYTHGHHVRTGSTQPTDDDHTISASKNYRGYMIRSNSNNDIRGSSGNLAKDFIVLETVAAPTIADASASASSASTTPSSATKSEGKQSSGPRPRRKKMAAIGVDAMKKMSVTSSSVVVALPESPTRKHDRVGEQRDDIESVFNNIRSTSNRKVLAFDLSVPSMPDMLSMMPAPALPTPAMNQSSSKQKNAMSHSNNDNDNMKKKKKQLQMGRRLRQIKKRLSLTKSKTSSSSKQEEKGEVCLSPGTSATTSTSSFGPTSQEEEDDDAPIFDMLTMMTTTLKPRVQSMFHEEEEMMMPIMPVHVLPAPPCPLSTTATSTTTTHEEERVVVVTTSFPSKLDKALSVFSPNEGDDDGDDDVGADDTDEWGVFASCDDDKEEERHKNEDQTHNDHHKYKPFSRSSFTKHTSHPCFPPRTHLPVVFAATTAGAE